MLRNYKKARHKKAEERVVRRTEKGIFPSFEKRKPRFVKRKERKVITMNCGNCQNRAESGLCEECGMYVADDYGCADHIDKDDSECNYVVLSGINMSLRFPVYNDCKRM